MDKSKTSFWRSKKVLVTGGAGFLGRWLIQELLKKGARPTTLDVNPRAANFLPCPVQRVNLTNFVAVKRLLKREKPSVILHLAGQAGLKFCQDNPSEAYQSNVLCTLIC